MKASEHFDLPLEANQESVYQSDGTDEAVAGFNTPEQAQIAANCINHADKLADALDNVIETLELYGAHDDPYYRVAIDELKKYRGCSDE